MFVVCWLFLCSSYIVAKWMKNSPLKMYVSKCLNIARTGKGMLGRVFWRVQWVPSRTDGVAVVVELRRIFYCEGATVKAAIWLAQSSMGCVSALLGHIRTPGIAAYEISAYIAYSHTHTKPSSSTSTPKSLFIHFHIQRWLRCCYSHSCPGLDSFKCGFQTMPLTSPTITNHFLTNTPHSKSIKV